MERVTSVHGFGGDVVGAGTRCVRDIERPQQVHRDGEAYQCRDINVVRYDRRRYVREVADDHRNGRRINDRHQVADEEQQMLWAAGEIFELPAAWLPNSVNALLDLIRGQKDFVEIRVDGRLENLFAIDPFNRAVGDER